MKKLIFIFSIAASSLMIGCMSVPVSYDQPVVVQFDAPYQSQGDLFIKAYDWMIESFVDSESVIEYSDKVAGRLSGKYVLNNTLQSTAYGNVGQVIKAKIYIYVKDGKSKIEIKALNSWQYDNSGMTIYNYSVDDAKSDMQSLADNYRQFITRAVASNNDW